MHLDADPTVAQAVPEDRPCDGVCGIFTVVERNVLAVGDLCRQRVAFHGAGNEQALTLRLEKQGGECEVALMAQAGEIEDVLRTRNEQRVEPSISHSGPDRRDTGSVLRDSKGSGRRVGALAAGLMIFESQPSPLFSDSRVS